MYIHMARAYYSLKHIKERRTNTKGTVKPRYLLTSITWLYYGLTFRAHRGHVFFKLTADQVLFFDWIAGSNQVNALGQKEGLHAKAKVGHKNYKLTSGVFLTFLLTFLAQSMDNRRDVSSIIHAQSFLQSWKN